MVTAAPAASQTKVTTRPGTPAEERAATVRNYLLRRGLPEARVTSLGKGSAAALESNDTSSGRAQNRRIELEVTK